MEDLIKTINPHDAFWEIMLYNVKLPLKAPKFKSECNF